MNRKYVLLGFILLFSITSYGQVQNNMNNLVTQCGIIVEYSQQIIQLKDSIRNASQKILELRNKWEKTCNDYLASDEQTSEDFQYLISNTDSINETDLYAKLVDASKKVKDNKGHEKLLPINDAANPVIKQEPTPIESDNDGKETEKEEDKKEKKKDKNDKNESPTTPIKKSKGDMDDELKSKIGNKGKN